LKENREAIEVLNIVLETNPYNEIAWLESGKQYLNLNQKKEALSAFDFAIISEDTFVGAYIEKAKLLESMGRINQAIENYEIATRLEDPSAYLYIRIAICHQYLGNDQMALQYFKKGINEDPSYEKAWTGIVDFYIERQNPIKALYYCEKGLQINENYVSYWKRNALLNKTLGKYEEAEIAFQSTIELGNYELSIWMEWLDTLIFLHEWEKGYTIGQQAKEFYSEEFALDYKIAGCFYKLGKSIEMEYYLQNVNKKLDQIPQTVLDQFPQLIKLLQQ
jgi:tetratricopeptide (TPR) repeat protein